MNAIVHDQHFTRDMRAVEAILDGLGLAGRAVLEIGAGQGALTQALLLRGVASVLAFEIEPGLCPLADARLDLREVAFTEDAAVDGSWDCIVAIPPYSLLPAIFRVADARRVEDVVVMAPGKYTRAPLWPRGFEVVAELPNEAFHPPSTGTHHILRRGFR